MAEDDATHSSVRLPTATMATNSAHTTCNQLIRRCIDLHRLYRHAAQAVNEPGLRAVLGEDAQVLAAVVVELQNDVTQAGGEARRRGSWRAALRCRMVGSTARVADRQDNAWIRALAQDESALLRAFERAIAALPEDTARSLRRQLPRLRGIHMDMHSLAGAAHS
jgi:uncharacterized protein (TIGR02284 family)